VMRPSLQRKSSEGCDRRDGGADALGRAYLFTIRCVVRAATAGPGADCMTQ
jgi:hypothetical protein